MGLGTMIEKAAAQIQEDKILKESNNGSEDDEEALEEELFAEPAEIEQGPQDLYDFLEYEDNLAEADKVATSGEVPK